MISCMLEKEEYWSVVAHKLFIEDVSSCDCAGGAPLTINIENHIEGSLAFARSYRDSRYTDIVYMVIILKQSFLTTRIKLFSF
ncbi:hypothetical protein ACLKA6_002499 [Drosophila palustris]